MRACLQYCFLSVPFRGSSCSSIVVIHGHQFGALWVNARNRDFNSSTQVDGTSLCLRILAVCIVICVCKSFHFLPVYLLVIHTNIAISVRIFVPGHGDQGPVSWHQVMPSGVLLVLRRSEVVGCKKGSSFGAKQVTGENQKSGRWLPKPNRGGDSC